MKIRKARVLIGDEVNAYAFMDVIEYEKKFWLVPEWIENKSLKVMKPIRIISLETMAHHRRAGVYLEFLVEFPVPRLVFEGRAPPEIASKYVVIEDPDILFPVASPMH